MSRRPWTESELELLSNEYLSSPTKSLAVKLGRSVRKVYSMANRRGLCKSKQFMASEASGRVKKGQTIPGSEAHQFRKGQAPANKGLRRPGWHRGRMRETQFQPGQRSGMAAKNWVPVGSIRADSEGYLRIKIREAMHGKKPTGFGNTKVWPLYNRYLWEQEHGPIPPAHIVTFKDGDRANCVLDNLELISMADNARRNTMWTKFPRELAEAIQLNGVIKRKIRRLCGEK